MPLAISLAVCVFALLTSRSQTQAKGSLSPPGLAHSAPTHQPDSSGPPHLTAVPREASQTAALHIATTVSARTDGTVHSGTGPALTTSSGAWASSPNADVPAATTAAAPPDPSTPVNVRFRSPSILQDSQNRPSHMAKPVLPTLTPPGRPALLAGKNRSSAPTHSGSSTDLQHHPTLSEAPLTKDPAPATLSQTHSSTPGLLTTVSAAQLATVGHRVAPATGGGPAGLTGQQAPSELNVGDEDPSGRRLRPTSPLDPLLAGLLSVFIVSTAFIFIILFLKFRQRMNHPEFHRLQDLPMDDLMEDTPLSRYTY